MQDTQEAFYIIGLHKGKREVLDVSYNYPEAFRMIQEYRQAYGSNWIIYLKTKNEVQYV